MIVMSGLDSSGKSTQINMLVSLLNNRGISPRVIWSRGGYTGTIEFLKKIIRLLPGKNRIPDPSDRKKHDEMFGNSIFARFWLVIAIMDLIRLYSIQIRFYNALAITVICDRYIEDTLIDFKIKFGNIDFEKWHLWRLLERTAPKSAYSFLIEIPIEESIRRSINKEEPFPEDMDRRKIRNGHYMERKKSGYWNHIIDGTKSRQEVFSHIIRELPL